ncbi:MAG TPA: NrfD/PsrC family molybdoenzyme membrane anchor subunit [Nocardioidaceae bacterium]|nr:NrfD/PsrC family molybdoenzyme membrane anchor subunit [Nocardioidaceae bacterium]
MFGTELDHFVRSPDWTWYILGYFFFAGISGGTYVLASLLRLRGDSADEPAARLGYYVSFAALVPCPVLLILDLGRPLRFWHMMWNTTPDDTGLNFKYWSPMSVGVWALVVFGAFATIAFVEALVRDDKVRIGLARRAVRLLDGTFGRGVMVVGTAFGLFIAGYTGVLLAVSNQPVWSDTWTLGGVFLASALSGSVAALTVLSRYRRGAEASADALTLAERLYALLEAALIVLFVLTLIQTGSLDIVFGFPWLLLWLVAFAGLVPGLAGLLTARLAVTGNGIAVAVHSASAVRSVAVPTLVLLGVVSLRAAIIFSVQ